MKTFLNNLSNKMKKSKAWRFLVGISVKELPDKFTKIHNDYLKKETSNTIKIPKKKIKNKYIKPVVNPELIDCVTEISETKPSFVQSFLPVETVDDIAIQIKEVVKNE